MIAEKRYYYRFKKKVFYFQRLEPEDYICKITTIFSTIISKPAIPGGRGGDDPPLLSIAKRKKGNKEKKKEFQSRN